MQHGREAPSASAHGLLLGLDLDGILEVSNNFPLPSHASEEEDKSSKSIGGSLAGIFDRRWNKHVDGSTVSGIDVAITQGSARG